MSLELTIANPAAFDAESGLTPEEREVATTLVIAWNRFIQMDAAVAPDDLEAMRQAINAAHTVLMWRAVRQQWPKYWR